MFTVKPVPAPEPTSDAGPVPGYSGDWWIEQNRTSSVAWKMSFVPLPGCTSQSTISTRPAPWAPSAWRGERVAGGDGDVVEEAEAHPAGRLGVVAGRAVHRRAVARLAAEQRVDHRDRAAGRVQRALPGPRRQDRVHVEVAAAAQTDRLDPLDVLARMDGLERRALDGGRLADVPPEPVALAEGGLDRLDALGALGVRAGLMGVRGGVLEQDGGHGAGYGTPRCRASASRPISRSWAPGRPASTPPSRPPGPAPASRS